MQNKLEVLYPDTFYHIYNRANGNEKLFLSDENYLFFLRKFAEYISPICNTYCYCLMPNHFHFLMEIKSEKEFSSYTSLISKIPTLLKRDELLAWYDDVANFEFVHKTKQLKSDFDCLGD